MPSCNSYRLLHHARLNAVANIDCKNCCSCVFYLPAVHFLFVCSAQNSPWAQSAAYQSALRDTRNPTPMTLTGRGDPTGRGRGFAFTREDPKKAKEEAAPPPGVKAQADGTITGGGKGLGGKAAGRLLLLLRSVPPHGGVTYKLIVACGRASVQQRCHLCDAAAAYDDFSPFVAGTDADLRRLGHKRAGELLMSKFGMDADTVSALARWDRIDAIRR